MIILIAVAIMVVFIILDNTALKNKKIIIKNQNTESTLLACIERHGSVILLVMTVVYGIVSIYNLGNYTQPTNGLKIRNETKEIIVKVEKDSTDKINTINSCKYLIGNNNGRDIIVSVEHSNDGTSWSDTLDMNGEHEEYIYNYKWQIISVGVGHSYYKIKIKASSADVLELAFYNEGKEIVETTQISGDEGLFDEQDDIPVEYDLTTDSYFDEFFYVQNAYDIITGQDPSAPDHPYLATELISLGVLIFGQTPFGYRFMGWFFGLLMIPLMYIFGVKIFRKKSAGLFVAFLMMTDFMHFVQSRVATIETFIVFFMILVFFFIYDIYSRASSGSTKLPLTVYKDRPVPLPLSDSGTAKLPLTVCKDRPAPLPLSDSGTAKLPLTVYKDRPAPLPLSDSGPTKLPLTGFFLAGISVGLAISCKWTGLYSIFVIIPVSMIAFVNIYINTKPKLFKYIAKCTGLFTVCFVAIPLIIYFLSYIPVMLQDGKGLSYFIEHQQHMSSFHSGYNPDLDYTSEWYEWLLVYQPFLYSGFSYLDAYDIARNESISSFGNPMLYWLFIYAYICLFGLAIKKINRKYRNTAIFLLLSITLFFLPWLGVGRIKFIYYIYMYIPLLCLALCLVAKYYHDRKIIKVRTVLVFCLLLAVTFVFFYPVLSGMNVSADYVTNWLIVMENWQNSLM